MDQSRRSAVKRMAVLAAGVSLAGAVVDRGPAATAAEGVNPVPASSGQLRTIDVRAHGAVGDNVTDAAPAVRAALKALTDRNSRFGAGGIVYFPAGLYAISTPLTIPKNVYLVGESPIASRIRYSGTSRIPTFLTFGRSKQIATYSGVKSLWVDGDGRADRDLLFYGGQEGSTVSETIATGALRVVLEIVSSGITGGSNKFVVERCWFWTIGDQGVAGIRVNRGGGPLSIRDSTVAGTNRTRRAPAFSAGIVAGSSIITVDNVNVEYFESHTYLDRTQADIRGATGFFNRYGVRTSRRSTTTAVSITNADFDQTSACVLDEGAGVRIRYCRTYISEAYPHDRRHFRRNHWDVGSTNVFQSDTRQVTMGFTSPATADTREFKLSSLQSDGWKQSATIDADGVFGSAASTHDGAHLRLGRYHLWVDRQGRLRIREGAPRSDGDGSVVGG